MWVMMTSDLRAGPVSEADRGSKALDRGACLELI